MHNDNSIVYMSALLKTKYPQACGRLTDILSKHGVPFVFLEGTRDIWCRDYMPIQTPSGKLIQFKYEPTYLQEDCYADLRTDVHHMCRVNGFTPEFSDINLDGGNVVMFQDRAIITDRIYSENSKNKELAEPELLLAKLRQLLECEIIIIPAYKKNYDFTGHADGMMRFVDRDTVLVNDLECDFKYMKKAIIEALDQARLRYINFPFFEHKIKEHPDNAIGVYLNYLEVGNLIVMPVFECPGNKDAEALELLQSVFPDKIIETINYYEVALHGGILNCTTQVLRP